MAYPGDDLWRRPELWRWLATATLVTLVPAMVLGAAAALSNSPGYQAVNRAAKSDALVSSTMLEMKRGLRLSWDQFFHDRQPAEPRGDVRLVAESSGGEKIVAGPTLKQRFVTDFE